MREARHGCVSMFLQKEMNMLTWEGFQLHWRMAVIMRMATWPNCSNVSSSSGTTVSLFCAETEGIKDGVLSSEVMRARDELSAMLTFSRSAVSRLLFVQYHISTNWWFFSLRRAV